MSQADGEAPADYSGPVVEVCFDGSVVSLIAIKKAAYRLSDTFAATITVRGEEVCCRLRPLNAAALQSADVEHTFRTAVLDEDLREHIGAKTEPLRTAIMALAFAPFASSADE